MDKVSKTSSPLFFWFYLAFLVWLPLPLGSNRPWAWNLAEIWVYGMLAWWLIGYLRGRLMAPQALIKARFIIGLLLLWLLWLSLQTLALPVDWAALLSPSITGFLPDSVSLSDGYTTLSLDPYATRVFINKSLMYLGVFVLSLLALTSVERARRCIIVLVVVGVFQAIFGAMMVFTGVEHSFFVEKESYRGLATGTFINRNHLAGHLEMVLAAGIGLLLADLKYAEAITWRQRLRNLAQWLLSPKMRLRVYLAIMVIGLVLTHSRMGNTAFFSSLLIAGVLWVLLSGKRPKGVAVLLLVSLVVIDIYILGEWFGLEKVVQRLEETTVETETRDDVYLYGLQYLEAFYRVGSGAGSFYSVFPAYRGEHVKGFYDQAHNDYLQIAVETGVPGLLLLALVVSISLVVAARAIRRRYDPLCRGLGFAAMMGMISLMIHSTVDFNLQIPANAAYFMLMLAFAWLAIGLPRDRRSADWGED